jgi:hypothetical protein
MLSKCAFIYIEKISSDKVLPIDAGFKMKMCGGSPASPPVSEWADRLSPHHHSSQNSLN